MNSVVRLSGPQQDLLDAMRRGVRVHFMYGLKAHCFRSDTMASCTKQVDALLKRGIIESFNSDWRGCQYRPVPNSVLCVNDRMTACEECGEEWPAGDHERWRLVNGQQVCAKCAKEAEPMREADPPPAKPRRMKANPKHSCEGNPYHGTEHDELASCVTIYLCEPVDAPGEGAK